MREEKLEVEVEAGECHGGEVVSGLHFVIGGGAAES
jgi:hypothetical protein